MTKSKRLPARCLVCGAMYTVTRRTYDYGTPIERQVYECSKCGDQQFITPYSEEKAILFVLSQCVTESFK